MAVQWTDRIGRRVKLRDLHILLAVVQSGSMGKAATTLGVSQPAVWKSLADLEAALGVRLLERSKQGVEPTLHGRALLKCGIAVFDELRSAVKELEFLSDPTIGELRIGCTEPLAGGFIATAIDHLSQRYPKATLHVVPADRSTLLDRQLRQRHVELAVMSTEGVDVGADTDVEFLFNDGHVIMVGAQSRWARSRKVALANLINEPWILPPPHSIVGLSIAEAFRASGFEPPPAHVVSFSVPLHYHLISTGRFLTMLPASMVQFDKHSPLTILRIESPPHRRPIGIITLKNRTLSPLARLFIDRAREVARPLSTAKVATAPRKR
jgi:DNA-binding transcriptional LysR family regulator